MLPVTLCNFRSNLGFCINLGSVINVRVSRECTLRISMSSDALSSISMSSFEPMEEFPSDGIADD